MERRLATSIEDASDEPRARRLKALQQRQEASPNTGE
jgi:hypothetical protein